MKNSEKKCIICFAPGDWWGMNPSCATHIMKRLAKDNRVLYINPFSSDLSSGLKKGITTRIFRKLKSLVKIIRRPEPGFFVFSPFFFPMQGKPAIDSFNNCLLRVQFWSLCRILRFNNPIVWVENLRSADLLDRLKSSLVVYHVSDLFINCRYTLNRKALKRRERKLLSVADLIVCVSDPLYQRHLKLHSKVFYIPHGVDFSAFRKSADSDRLLPELENIPKPIAGYFGTMTASNDIELLLYCAKNLPDVSFVYAGQVTAGDYSQLFSLPNVFYLGKLPYEKIPMLCAGFDVCMLPWKMTDWIYNCNPLKLLEYMASGHPIVSVPIREVEKNYFELVSIAHTKEQFCDALKWELLNDTPQRADARIDIARQNSWDEHVKRISDLIEKSLTQKKNSENLILL